MPEGDTLFKIAGYLRPRLVGRVVERAQLLARSAPELVRRRVLAVDVHGKHLLVRLSPASHRGWCLRVHLGMFGAWHAYPTGGRWQRPAWQASVVLEVAGAGVFVCFAAQDVALERFAAAEADAPQRLTRLGPQLLREADGPAPAAVAAQAHTGTGGRTGAAWRQTLQPAALDDDLLAILDRLASRPPTQLACDVLLDQRIAAGFGNVYKSELLFLFRVHPTQPLGALSPWLLASLFARGRALLEQNVGGWPRTTTVDRRRAPLPRHLPRLWIYNRTGAPCLRCGALVVRALLGRHRRSTFWCPRCQPPQGRLPIDHVPRLHGGDLAF